MRTLSEKLRGRRRPDRPMTTVSIPIPEDLIPDLEEMAPVLGFGSYVSLIRSYISQGMRQDEALLADPDPQIVRETLEQRGVSEDLIRGLLTEAARRTA